MTDNRTTNSQKLISIFLVFGLFFNFPLLTILNIEGHIFGIPRLYFFLFVLWAVLIGLLAFVSKALVLENTPTKDTSKTGTNNQSNLGSLQDRGGE